jgi:hypothetical protein
MTKGTLQTFLSSLPKAMDLDALRKAHEHAEDFHSAMADALAAEGELSETDESMVPHWQNLYQDALEKAAAAASKMPAVWLSILGVEVIAQPAAPAQGVTS